MPFGSAAIAAPVVSGFIGAGAAKDAAKTQAAATDRATAAEMSMYDQTVAREQPFVQGGTNALNALQRLLGIGPGGGGAGSPILSMLGIGPGGGGSAGFDPTTFRGSPGYNFARGQGIESIQNSASATGGVQGGNTLKALQKFGTGLADQDFYNYLASLSGGWNSLTGGLQSLVGGGASAAANLGQIGTQVAGQVGGNIIGGGNAQASGIVGSSNAITGGLNSSIANLLKLNQMNYMTGTGGGFPGAFPQSNNGFVDSGSWGVPAV